MPVLTFIARLLEIVHTRVSTPDHERGDVPGWVLVTMMTAMLVAGLWTFFQGALENVFTAAMQTVMGG